MEVGRKVVELGEVDVSGGSRRTGNVSRYLVERFGFDAGALTWQLRSIRSLTFAQIRWSLHLPRIFYLLISSYVYRQAIPYYISDPWIS